MCSCDEYRKVVYKKDILPEFFRATHSDDAAHSRNVRWCSCDKYRQVVYKTDSFVDYFRAATPDFELKGLNLGSR